MARWPFGRLREDTDIVSRIAEVRAQDGVLLRGKLTLHFSSAVAADEGDGAAELVVRYLRLACDEVPTGAELLGSEAAIGAELAARVCLDVPWVRAIHLQGLHVVGGPRGTPQPPSAEAPAWLRAASKALAELSPPSSGTSVEASSGKRPIQVAEAPLPPSSGAQSKTAKHASPVSGAEARREPTVRRKPSVPQLQVASVRLQLPRTASPYEVARRLTPLVRDASARVLVAFVRAYDLLGVRRVAIDSANSEMLDDLAAHPDSAPGSYMASHDMELARWRTALGEGCLSRLARETSLIALFLALSALDEVGVASGVRVEIVEALAWASFSNEDLLADLPRYQYALAPTITDEATTQLAMILSAKSPAGIQEALSPLFEHLQDELVAAATLAKEAMLGRE